MAGTRQGRTLRSQAPGRRAPEFQGSTEEALKRIIERFLDALSSEYISDTLHPVWTDAKRAVGRER